MHVALAIKYVSIQQGPNCWTRFTFRMHALSRVFYFGGEGGTWHERLDRVRNASGKGATAVVAAGCPRHWQKNSARGRVLSVARGAFCVFGVTKVIFLFVALSPSEKLRGKIKSNSKQSRG